MYFLLINPPCTLVVFLTKNGQSTKGIVALGDKILMGWSSSNFTNFHILGNVFFVKESTVYIGVVGLSDNILME